MHTRTGNFPIGFRRGWSEWQKDLKALAAWTKTSGFARLDLGQVTRGDMDTLAINGLKIGSADLLNFGKLMANDLGERKALLEQNIAYVKEAASFGAKVFFTCVIPGDPNRKRAENYKFAVECFTPLAQAADKAGAQIAIEGWPGGGGLANLCCNPETYRAFIKDCGCKSIGVNYDPSHLIRMGIDPIRFLNEFAPRVWHVHGKDTALMPEAVYELGLYQGSAFNPGHGFGEHVWRYTIPGHGCTRWTEVCKILAAANYKGAICVELEDENFNGKEETEKAGLVYALEFLKSA